MVDPYALYLIAVSRRGLLKKVNKAAQRGYALTSNIEHRPLAFRKWRATMAIQTLPDTPVTRAMDEFLADPSTGVRRMRHAA